MNTRSPFSIFLPSVSHRCAAGAAVTIAMAMVTLGCQSRVQREVYSNRMTGEIRVLEDQLYDADYQNRVLRDELKRVKAECEPSPSKIASPTENHSVHSQRDAGSSTYGPIISDSPAIGSEVVADPMALMDQPSTIVDERFPVDGQTTESYPIENQFGETITDQGTAPTVPSVPYVQPPTNPPSENLPSPAGELDDAGELPAPLRTQEDFGELPPPRGIEPPGPETFKVPPIEPGKLAPPPLPGTQDDGPPGKVVLPKGLDASLNYSPPSLPEPVTPDHIQLHPSLSSAHQFDEDDEADGLWVVVNVVDADGHILNLHDFDVDASMTIVALDPTLDASSNRIGRWDFSVDEVKSFVRSIPVDGFHIPIQWDENEPVGEEVIVHVRLQAEGEEMRCQGKLQLKSQVAMSKWLPRGGELKR